jgi:hypothetical protein
LNTLTVDKKRVFLKTARWHCRLCDLLDTLSEAYSSHFTFNVTRIFVSLSLNSIAIFNGVYGLGAILEGTYGTWVMALLLNGTSLWVISASCDEVIQKVFHPPI